MSLESPYNLSETDFLPDELPEDLGIFVVDSPLWRSMPWGVVFPLLGGSRWGYLERDARSDFDLVSFGCVTWSGFTGHLEPPTHTWLVRPQLIDRLFENAPVFRDVTTWRRDGVVWVASAKGWTKSSDGDLVPELQFSDLTSDRVNFLAQDQRRSYYWSDLWTPEFYTAQAKAGFIAVAASRGNEWLLLPELQSSYAVLDWRNLHLGKNLRRWFRSPQSSHVRLVVNLDPSAVLGAIEQIRGEDSWIVPQYANLLKELNSHDLNIKVYGVELWYDSVLAAGELGYVIGRTYTSLSGFHRSAKKEYNDLGKVQMVLLAQLLEQSGLAFWNLGHPYMEYKMALGARALPRQDFLARWRLAVSEVALAIGVKE